MIPYKKIFKENELDNIAGMDYNEGETESIDIFAISEALSQSGISNKVLGDTKIKIQDGDNWYILTLTKQ
jgi:hypothetical protein